MSSFQYLLYSPLIHLPCFSLAFPPRRRCFRCSPQRALRPSPALFRLPSRRPLDSLLGASLSAILNQRIRFAYLAVSSPRAMKDPPTRILSHPSNTRARLYSLVRLTRSRPLEKVDDDLSGLFYPEHKLSPRFVSAFLNLFVSRFTRTSTALALVRRRRPFRPLHPRNRQIDSSPR